MQFLVLQRLARLADLALPFQGGLQAGRDEASQLGGQRIDPQELEDPIHQGGRAEVRAQVAEGGEVLIGATVLAALEGGEPEEEPRCRVPRGLRHRPFQGLDGGVVVAELVAREPEADEGVEPLRIVAERGLEAARRLVAAALAIRGGALAVGRGASTEERRGEERDQRLTRS